MGRARSRLWSYVLASSWYHLLRNEPCFHKDGYKLDIFPKLVSLLLLLPMSCFLFPPPARPLGRWAPTPSASPPQPPFILLATAAVALLQKPGAARGYKLHDPTLYKRVTLVTESASRKANERKWTQALMICILSIPYCKDLLCSSIK